MKNISEIEKLEKELEKLDKKQEEQGKKFREKERELRKKIKSLKEDEAKNKLGGKFYNKVVHVTETQPYFGLEYHSIGVIDPDTVCAQGFYMYKNAIYARIENDAVTWIRLEEYRDLGVKVNPHELFKNETVTYGNDTPDNRKRIITIKIASKEDREFIRQMFETKKKQDNAEMDKLRDFCISLIK